MRIALSAFACVWAITTIAAQAPVRDGAPPAVPTGTGAISGVVRDEAGPLRRAMVVISGDMRLERAAITDDEGRFGFQNLPTGRFTITASKPAYPSTSYGAKRANRPGAGVLLGAGQQVTDIAITLVRGAVITGTVFDDRGQPMPGVPVMPWEVRMSLSGERTLEYPSTGGVATTSDDLGRFRFYGLPAGEYTVGTSWSYGGLRGEARVHTDAEIQAAFAAGARPAAAGRARADASPSDATPAYNYTQIFHPSSLDPMVATTVRLAAGEERDGMDLHMRFRPMSKIVVELSGPAGMGPAGVTIQRTGRVAALNSGMEFPSRDARRFESHSLGPGDYAVMAHAGGGGRPVMWGMRDVTLVGGESVTEALELQPALTATGRVIFDGAPSSARPAFSDVSVSLQTVTPGRWGSLSSAAVDANGTFTRSDVTPSRFRLSATVTGTGAAAWTLRSVTIGGRDVTDLPIDIALGDEPSFVLTFTDQTSELSGSLLDSAGLPSTDYFVLVVPADRRYWLPQTRRIGNMRPDARGQFVFRGLPPGEYQLAATTDLVPRDLQDVAALEALLVQSLPVTIGVGEKKRVDIRVAGQDPNE